MRLAITIAALTFPASAVDAGILGPDCMLDGMTLQGKVEVVDSFPDLEITDVDSFPGVP